jgi:hypothetical protein
MPSRIVREGILESDRVQRLVELGGWEAEVFYRRLHQIADDFGRFSADPRLLRPRLYPLALDQMREANVSRCLKHCEAAGLVRLYSVNAKQYLEVIDFRQRTRASESKYPDPPDDGHMPDTCPADDGHPLTYSETKSETETKSVDWFSKFWDAWPKHPRKAARKQCQARWDAQGLDAKAGLILEALEAFKASPDWRKNDGQFIPAPLVWLNQNRWEAMSGDAAPPKARSVTHLVIGGEV